MAADPLQESAYDARTGVGRPVKAKYRLHQVGCAQELSLVKGYPGRCLPAEGLRILATEIATLEERVVRQTAAAKRCTTSVTDHGVLPVSTATRSGVTRAQRALDRLCPTCRSAGIDVIT